MLETASTSRISPSNLGSPSNIPKEGWGSGYPKNPQLGGGRPISATPTPLCGANPKRLKRLMDNTPGNVYLATVITKNSHQVQVTSLPSVVLTTPTATPDTS